MGMGGPGMGMGGPGMGMGGPGMPTGNITGFAEGMGPQISLGKVDSNMNNFLSGNMAGGSNDNKQKFKLNFF
jgi:hypothetical protein